SATLPNLYRGKIFVGINKFFDSKPPRTLFGLSKPDHLTESQALVFNVIIFDFSLLDHKTMRPPPTYRHHFHRHMNWGEFFRGFNELSLTSIPMGWWCMGG